MVRGTDLLWRHGCFQKGSTVWLVQVSIFQENVCGTNSPLLSATITERFSREDQGFRLYSVMARVSVHGATVVSSRSCTRALSKSVSSSRRCIRVTSLDGLENVSNLALQVHQGHGDCGNGLLLIHVCQARGKMLNGDCHRMGHLVYF